MVASDWPRVCEIYEEGITTANATFETAAPDWQQWDARHLSHCRLLAIDGDDVLGWAALSPVSARRVYAGVAEVSVYVAAVARGRGVGKALLNELILNSEQQGIWMLQAGIFPENLASIALHTALGFREVGKRERLGQLAGQWRDVVLMERRSKVAGL
jgi:L-amino acid N-acyltransferase YncA